MRDQVIVQIYKMFQQSVMFLECRIFETWVSKVESNRLGELFPTINLLPLSRHVRCMEYVTMCALWYGVVHPVRSDW